MTECTVGNTVHVHREESCHRQREKQAASRRVARWSERRSGIVRGEDLSLTGVWFEGSSSHCNPKCSEQEVDGVFSVPDSENMVREARCGFGENTKNGCVRLDKSVVKSRHSLRGHPAGVRSWRMNSRQRATSRGNG